MTAVTLDDATEVGHVGAYIPGAVGSTGMAATLYAVVTWIVAILVAWRFGRATLASRRDEAPG